MIKLEFGNFNELVAAARHLLSLVDAGSAPVQASAPVTAAPAVTAVPVAAVPVAVPAVAAAPAPVPTAQTTYTHEMLSIAAIQLKDQGKLGEVTKLNAAFGVQAITQLAPEQIPQYAAALQALGVKL